MKYLNVFPTKVGIHNFKNHIIFHQYLKKELKDKKNNN
jgi:hypothetical protein